MKKMRDWSISFKIAIVFIAMLTALASFTMFYFIYELGQYREQNGQLMRTKLTTEARDRQREAVNQAYDVVKYFYDVSQDEAALKKRAHDHLKGVVDAVLGQAKAFYEANKDTMPREEIESRIKELVRSARFDDNNYIWINDTAARMVMHPSQPALEGADLSGYRDPKGTALFMDMLKVAKDKGQGMVSYMWDKPGAKNDPKPKVSYVRLLPELGWIFGSGAWIEDETARLQAEAKTQLSKMRLLDGNYFFIYDNIRPVPRILMHPIRPDYDGKVLDTAQFERATGMMPGLGAPEIPYPAGKTNIATAMADAVAATGEGFVSYPWPKPLAGGGETTESYPKLSYVKLFKPWGWIVGMGDYIDGIERNVAAEAGKLNEAIRAIVVKLVLFSAIILAAMAALCLILVRRLLNRPISAIVAYADKVAGGDLNATVEADLSAEMASLSASIHAMVDHLKTELEFAKGILNSVTLPCVVADPSGKITLVNRWLAHFLGEKKEPEAYVGRPMTEVFASHAIVSRVLGDVMSRREIMTNVEYDGTYAWGERFFIKIDAAPISDDAGRMLGVFAMLATLTKVKLQQEALAEQNRLIATAANTAEGISAKVTENARDLAQRIESTNEGVSYQRQRTIETATAMEEMNATVLEVAQNAGLAASSADEAQTRARQGSDMVRQVVAAIEDVKKMAETLRQDMAELGNTAENIGQVLGVISDIADQTNLLALNAAIEAARAGDAGRGFAVVADEVRKLAEKTMTATREVGQAITAVQQAARRGNQETIRAAEAVSRSTDLAEKAGEALAAIVGMVENTADQVRAIATAAEQQSSTATEISRATEEVSRIAEDIREGMDASVIAVRGLNDEAQELGELIERMQTSSQDEADAKPARLTA